MKEPIAASANTGRPARPAGRSASLPRLGLSALGIVFGDIGTSPLYTLKTVLGMAGQRTGPDTVLGVLSLILWTLVIVTSLKYVAVAMRANNDGEGGILALMALLAAKVPRRRAIVAVGLLGAALIYGDGAITPAISVLSALEGLDLAAPSVAHYALPGSVVILILLFAVQSQGTARIGRAFGPVMALWFVTIGVLGLIAVLHHPGVLIAIDPRFAIAFLAHGGAGGFLILGGVFLCVTGAEALYADMGHFGAAPIRAAWSAVVFPALLLCYAGQAALVLDGVPVTDNIFYRLAPAPLLLPMILLATIATIIASQSIITGAFSMTRQAIQLGWLPRLHITQTSAEGYGQIYVGAVNWLLMVVTVALAIGFRKSDNLAAAYGIAVSATMLMTTGLLFVAMREVLRWPLPIAVAITLVFSIVDGGFLAANLAKIADGGYVPLLLAAAVYCVMWAWHKGVSVVSERLQDCVVPIDDFFTEIARRNIPRVPGTAVFLTRTARDVPPIMVWHVRYNRALHEQVLVLTIAVLPTPWGDNSPRLAIDQLRSGFWRATARYGFMERPDLPRLLREAKDAGCGIDLADVTYYVGHETIVRAERQQLVPRWVEALFAAMQRNAAHVTDFFQLPPESVVEIGREVAM